MNDLVLTHAHATWKSTENAAIEAGGHSIRAGGTGAINSNVSAAISGLAVVNKTPYPPKSNFYPTAPATWSQLHYYM